MPNLAGRLFSALTRNAIPGAQQRQLQLRNSYKRVFASEDGQAIMADLAKQCGTGDCLDPDHDPYKTHYNLGAYRVLRHIQTQGELTDAFILRAVDAERRADAAAIEGDE